MTESLPKLHILLCLGADFDCAYIPHLIRHYAGSVDSWSVLLHSRELDNTGAEVTTHAARLFAEKLAGVVPQSTLHTSVWLGEFNPYGKVDRLNELIMRSAKPGEWVIHVDADELIESPYNGFRALQAQCICGGQKVMYGVMIDRFALDRKPHPIYEADDLFVKFPLSEEFTKSKLKAWTHKSCLMLYEGQPLLANCHDYSGHGWKDYENSGLPILKVWHFKWIDSTRDKLRYRVTAFKRQRIGWWFNSSVSLDVMYPDKLAESGNVPVPKKSTGEHPYRQLESRSFWKTGLDEIRVNEIWRPKWQLGAEDKVVTFGSCFARHLGQALRTRGYNWLETEPPPAGLSPLNVKRFGYNNFSCRTGTITTPTSFRQWVNWSLGCAVPPDEYWVASDRFIDPFRPSIEPGGFDSLEEMLASRNQTLASMKRAILEADVLMFTLGMTESWVNCNDDWVYPVCPGTIAGNFDPELHRFVNLSYNQVHQALSETLSSLWAVRPDLKVLLSVSPVPLTATATGEHVLSATSDSKSTLRTVAGEFGRYPEVDYFPSYELVMCPLPLFGKQMFDSNGRSVSAWGVGRVMDTFFAAHGVSCSSKTESDTGQTEESPEDCDDAWAEAFIS